MVRSAWRPRPRFSYAMAAAWSVVAVLLGYAVLDVADAAPGALTVRPLPPPPPTETVATRTLPEVPQPSLSTSVGMPLPSLVGDTAAPSPAGVETALTRVRAAAALRDAALVVRDGQTGQVLLDQGGDELRIPASTTKLLSAAAIGQAFAPDEALRTVVRQGDRPDEIVLVAGGDSLINPGTGDPDAVAGRAGLRDLSDQVAAALEDQDVDSVRLFVDETYADGPTTAPTWSPTFRSSGITGAVAMLGLSSQRAKGGAPGPADPVAAVRDLFARQLEARGIDVRVAPRGDAPGVAGSPLPGPSTSGTPPTASAEASAISTSLGTASPESTVPASGPGSVLGSIESAPVREQLALALTDSDNALTEILARQAAYRSGAGTEFAEVGAWVVASVATLGLDVSGVRLSDASGLSRENRVRASLLADVLVLGYDGTHPVLRRALDGLPIGGLTGTLEKRFTGEDHDAAGRARAKTGTLTGANALAGSVVDDDGRLLVFAGMVAGVGTNDARAALDRFVATLASCGCR
ncbi:D-alanyl-D-alanine carboxypeptidase/D-alanyl-D-alanine-endopeptidase [Terrabacter sp. MAHUQ-38]|uniref:D-alanyl-D-alanine carboxypeptidase/D-alanyl-D-alanine-endopeptidase n=1 Tax=unclassified Terrabacter TaxID=2630222 RepID=UPI00165D8B72|nr:D-alanyl-D-alanine carboxypeptidase [Terrabacter sp. MAHUQ-38]MBC9822367.1 D-alanyl-D-alanine carboxypeptidase [Terrabacter sp. MAHUQ-38]